MNKLNPLPLIALLAGVVFDATAQPSSPKEAADLIRGLAAQQDALAEVPFAAVVEAATGKKIVPVKAKESETRKLLAKIESAANAVLRKMNADGSPAHEERRINEVSAHFEKALEEELNKIPGFNCSVPTTASGNIQRSGYPDLRVRDEATDRIVYLDPKLYKQNLRGSSLRTFYFTPKVETNKILDDAHHLIIGFAHDGKHDGKWKFSNWELVDLSGFKVRLKAEFQGSNRDLYREEAIVGHGNQKAE